MLEFIPIKQVEHRLSEGWQIVSQERGDYAALMRAPEGWEPVIGSSETISLLYRVGDHLRRLDGKKPFKRQGIHYSTCTIPECGGKHFAKGYCQKHYTRIRTHGHPRIISRPGPKPHGKCEEKGCRQKSVARGLCNQHYRRLLREENRTFRCQEAA